MIVLLFLFGLCRSTTSDFCKHLFCLETCLFPLGLLFFDQLMNINARFLQNVVAKRAVLQNYSSFISL